MNIPAERDALNIFPDMSADADNPQSYNFGPTDRLIASIKGVGAETIFHPIAVSRSVHLIAPPIPSDRGHEDLLLGFLYFVALFLESIDGAVVFEECCYG